MDINQAFRQAEQAFQQQNFQQAIKLTSAILGQTGPHPIVLHLLGLSQKQSGQLSEAAQTLASASRLAPNDAQITNNLGSILHALKRTPDAAAHYRKAIAQNPQLDDAKFNLGICLHELGHYDEAEQLFEDLTQKNPNIARLWSSLGALHLTRSNFSAAKTAYKKVLAIKPDHAKATVGLTRALLELGEGDALQISRDARKQLPDDPDLLINYSYALLAARDPDAGNELRQRVEKEPGWIAGQKALAAIYWEAGRTEEYTTLFEKSLAEDPDNDALRQALCKVYDDSDDYENAYRIAKDRSSDNGDIELAVLHADYASQTGRIEEAEEQFAKLPRSDLRAQLLKAKHALRTHRPDLAEQILQPVREQHPGNISAWAVSDIAWRLLDDKRHQWLHGQQNLYAARSLNLSSETIEEIVDYLRNLHGVGHAPLGQSLRDGTQTKGHLLERKEPVIAELRQAIEQSVAAHWEELPQEDTSHPLLRHRDKLPILKGSWSVRLTGKGFHVQHIHPQGLLSSACYLYVPEECEDEQTRPGWLELGRDAPDLGLAMDPIAQFKPEVGRIILFPSTLYHGTRPFSSGERITVAFDVSVA